MNERRSTSDQQQITDPHLAQLDTLATWLDNRFRIPGTNIRFGLDGIVGLVPYLGDIVGYLVSAILLGIMFQRGAGPILMLQMIGNVVFDAIIGIVPVVGDLFDFGYQANSRNVNLLRKYYADGKAKPDAKRSFVIVGLLFFALLTLLIWVNWTLSVMFVKWVWGFF